MQAQTKLALALAAAAVALAGCGASNQGGVDGSVLLQAQMMAQAQGTAFERVAGARNERATRLAATRTPTAGELFDWAELTFPALFPVKAKNQTFQAYTFRYYPGTDLIIAVTGTSVVGLLGVSSPAPLLIPLGNLADFTCTVLPAICTPTPAPLDTASVTTGFAEVSAFMSLCSKAAQQTQPGAPADAGEPSLLARAMELRRISQAYLRASAPPAAPPTRPADKLGDCGGRLSYPSWSHSGGITTGTSLFDNYCQTDTKTGNKQVINGSISYVTTGTPTASGPITTRQVANSPAGLAFVTRNAAGATQTSQTLVFNNYVYTPGVPGGKATSTSPDRVQIDEFVIGDNITSKTYRQTGYNLTTYGLSAGGSQFSVSGRGYRANGAYYDVATVSPILSNSAGDYTAGTLSFTGAGNTTAVATLVPGSKLQATMTVGGKPVTGAPACSN